MGGEGEEGRNELQGLLFLKEWFGIGVKTGDCIGF